MKKQQEDLLPAQKTRSVFIGIDTTLAIIVDECMVVSLVSSVVASMNGTFAVNSAVQCRMATYFRFR